MTPLFRCLLSATAALIILTASSGCIHSYKSPSGTTAALALISEIKNRNADLLSFKGSGSIRLTGPEGQNSFRLAWAGKNPDHLRATVLFSGRPVETLATDGKSFFLKSHTGQHEFIRYNSGDIKLQRFLSVPVRASALISLLACRTPVEKYTEAILKTETENGETIKILELKRPFRGVVQRFFLTGNSEIKACEITRYGKPVYRVDYDRYSMEGAFNLPHRILITARKATCHINISRYFPNADTSAVSFTLKE